MKIAIMSDLHLEFDARSADNPRQGSSIGSAAHFYLNPPQPQADVLVLAGDIHGGSLAVDWALRHFSIPTVLIGGNHEPYGHELFRVIAFARQQASATGGRVVFLERATWTCESTAGERVRFIGATLWTDFQLYGTPMTSMAIAQERLEDFRTIRIERGYRLRALRPSDTARLHGAAVTFLCRELSRPFDGMTVVVIHHASRPD